MKKTFKRLGSMIVSIVMIMSLTAVLPKELIKVDAATSADLSISQNGVNFICAREGFSAKCYNDGAQSSIGYGTKCGTSTHASGLHSIAKEAAMTAMMKEINNSYVPNVRRQTSGIQMNQNQFDALVSFTYNTGGGTKMIANSPLVKYLNGQLSESDARSQFANYIVTNSATGKVDQGLINRRKAEADLFFSGTVSTSFPGDEDNSYSVPISVTAGKKINTYDGNGNLESNRWIDPGDACTIDKVYKNGFVHIEYPISGGTRWAYAKKDDFDIKPAASSHSPELCVDSVTTGAGTISISGWAYDPDNKDASLTIDVYMDADNKWVGSTTAEYDDEDALKAVIGTASRYKHRFAATFITDQTGAHRLNIAALDTESAPATWSGHDINIDPDSVKPTISKVEITNVTVNGYNVIVTAEDNVGIKEVRVPVWTSEDDLVWHTAAQTGQNTWEYNVKISEHLDRRGIYHTHVYAYDFAGNECVYNADDTYVGHFLNLGDNFDATITNTENGKFVIASAENDNVCLYDTSGSSYASKRIWNFAKQPDGSYRITSYYNSKCLDVEKGNDADGTNICTYTSNGDTNQRWYIVKNGSNYRLMPACSNSRSLDVNTISVGNGANIQLWENNDSSAQSFSINIIKDTTNPVITKAEISNVTKDGYRVTVTVSEDIGVREVKVPVWTAAGDINGQDDLVWHAATQVDQDTWVYDVKISEHNNEQGDYCTHVYVYNFNGNWDMRILENTAVTEPTTTTVASNTTETTKITVKTTVKITDVTTEKPIVEAGDINGDGEINIADLVIMQKLLVNLYIMTAEQWEVADVNNDGKVNVFDMIIMKRIVINQNLKR